MPCRFALLAILPLLLALLLPVQCLAAEPKAIDPDIDEGHRLFAHEKYEEALEHYLKALKKNENDAELNYRTGMAYFCLMNFNSTIVYFEKAVKLDPEIEGRYAFDVSSKHLPKIFFDGDTVLIDNIHYKYKKVTRGDIVLLDLPHSNKAFTRLKVPLNLRILQQQRIIGVPGDTLGIRGRGVFINNKKIFNIKLNLKDYFFSLNSKTIIPNNNFFVSGDRGGSKIDSMFFGFVNNQQILGKILLIYYSINYKSDREIPRKERIGLKVK